MQTSSILSSRHVKALITAVLTVLAVAATAATEVQTIHQPDETTRPIKLEMIRKAVIASRGLL